MNADDQKLDDYLKRRKRTRAALGGIGVGVSGLWPIFLAAAFLGLLVFLALTGDAGGNRIPQTPLGRAALAWRPLTRAEPELLDQIARHAEGACARMFRPLPDAERCPALLVALAFRESSWEPEVVGRLGEVGLMQIHGVAARGYSREELEDPGTNVRVGARWLDHAALGCSLTSGRNLAERSLSSYAGLGCVRSASARMVLRWAESLHEIVRRSES